ncbi:aspartate aminotransferase family protein [Clostridium sp. BJN0001]|uniref:aspartate aminotransferase family protein n=1 Tax=Clostridium sp. BJN0001 TaxID=2930219 RepID=UPI001FD5A18D|nr:aspartate aminotransferase family protein [Clostridium sp. BJN0001]
MNYDFNEAKTHLMDTYGRLDPVIVKGEGVYLYDKEGKEYIDFTSGIGVSCLGYGNKKWLDAVSMQLNTLVHSSNIFLNDPSVKLAKELTEKAHMSRVFFGNSGAEANEGAIKLARKYSFDKYGKGRSKILTLVQSFHGRTITTLQATGQDKFHKFFYPFTEGFDYVKANDTNDFKSKLTSDVCAIMLEAIQGEGGVIPLDKNFVQKVCSIAKEKDILVIFDEVQCGIARTGKLFAYEHFDVKPDIVTTAKALGAGLPIGGFLCNDKLKNVLKKGDHASTFGANPVICAGALVVLDTLCNDKSYTEISKKGDLIKDILSNSNNDKILDIRGKGLMVGIKTSLDIAKIQKECLKNGLLILTAGKDVLRLLPPLVISDEEIKKGLNILLDVLQKMN